MRTKTPQQSEKILTVAARLFATHRFHEARMEDIASEAEVGKGTLYRYFKDKEELYVALLERASHDLTRRMDEAVNSAEGPRSRLESVVTSVFAYFDEQPYLFDVIQHAEAMQRPGGSFPFQGPRDHYRQILLSLFEEAKAASEFVIADPEMAVLLLQGGMRSVFRFGKRPRPPGYVLRALEMFLHGAAASSDARASRRANGKITSGA